MTADRGWRIAAASSIGTSHEKSGSPCQDAHAVKLLAGPMNEEILILVVSDGAGSASKAEVGSSLICSTIIDIAKAHFEDGGRVDEIELRTAVTWIEMIQEIVSDYAFNEGGALRDYAGTMLVAVIGADSAATIQIGDGGMVVRDGSGWHEMHWPQRGEFVNTTFFATDCNPEEQISYNFCPQRIDEIALFSDGIERLVLNEKTGTPHSPFFDKIFLPVRKLGAPGLHLDLSESLGRFLNSATICERTDDDKTLILATRVY